MIDKGYNGNLNIPSAGSKYQYTQIEIEEYIKCKNDPVYFAEQYFKIIHVDKGIIPLEMYEFQKEAARAYLTNRKMCICTSRQIGKTTVATVIILHYIIFNQAKKVALLANKGDTAREILERIKLAYEHLPRFLQVGVSEWNKGSVSFENKCSILAASSSSDSIRGKSVAMLYIDENAFVSNWNEFSASVLPVLSSGTETKNIFTSTPNGLNHFYYYCKGAKEGKNGYYYIEVPWYKIPGRDEKWKEEILQTINYDMDKFEVEYCCRFSGSSGTLISGAALQSMVHENPKNSINGLSVYEEPFKDELYFIVCDVSRGKGLDYSALQVLKSKDKKFYQVASYNNNLITPTDFAGVVFNIGKAYNTAPLLIEINDIGEQVAYMIYNDYEYDNVFFTKGAGRNGVKLSWGSSNSNIGVRTTSSVKSVGCSILKLLIEQDRLIIKDKDTITQLSVFSRHGNSYKAEDGYHDDLVMCLVLFSWMSQDQSFIEMVENNVLLDIRQQTEEDIFNDLTPFGFIVNGDEEVKERIFNNTNELWSLVT